MGVCNVWRAIIPLCVSCSLIAVRLIVVDRLLEGATSSAERIMRGVRIRKDIAVWGILMSTKGRVDECGL